MAYHLQTNGTVSATFIPIFYAVAMGVSGGGSLLFGRLFDKVGIALWVLGIGIQESLILAAVATMVPRSRRASAYGIFTASYGISLFLGSVILGFLYNVGRPALIAFGIIAELAAIPVLLWVIRKKSTITASE